MAVRELQKAQDTIEGLEAQVWGLKQLSEAQSKITTEREATISCLTAENAGLRKALECLNEVAPAVENLASHQEQCDMDGVMVKVSRQAVDEVLSAINAAVAIATPTESDAGQGGGHV